MHGSPLPRRVRHTTAARISVVCGDFEERSSLEGMSGLFEFVLLFVWTLVPPLFVTSSMFKVLPPSYHTIGNQNGTKYGARAGGVWTH